MEAQEKSALEILSAVPEGMKPGEYRKVDCPQCGGKGTLYVAKSGFNGHLFVQCPCGVMVMT